MRASTDNRIRTVASASRVRAGANARHLFALNEARETVGGDYEGFVVSADLKQTDSAEWIGDNAAQRTSPGIVLRH